jgi:MFS family permease
MDEEETPEGEHVAALHREAREELARADGKATTLLGVVGLILGALLAGVIAGDWTPSNLGCAEEVVFWIGAAAAGTAEGLLCAAVIPRLKHDKDRDAVAYFGHVVQFDSEDEFIRALEKAPRGRLADQIWHISRSVQTKYRLIQLGLLAFAGGLVLMAAALALHAL